MSATSQNNWSGIMIKKALVVLSGGQDSTTCLFWANHNYDEVHAITFDYGQKHRIEIDAAIKVAQIANVASHEIIHVPNILNSVSPLLSNNELEEYESFEQMDTVIGNRIELTFVPMRNPFFLTVATNRAYELGCEAIITGVCEQDNANYPDCRGEFISAFESMLNQALGFTSEDCIRIETPLLHMTKAESVLMANTDPDCWKALSYSHTSYDGLYPPTGMNHANVLRAQGFLEAGLPDPLVVRAWKEGLMDLPQTDNYKEVK